MSDAKALKHSFLFGGIILFLSFFVFFGPLAFFKIPAISFVGDTRGPLWAIILFFIGGFSPTILGLLLSRITDGKEGFRKLLKKSLQFKIGASWYLIIVSVIFFSELFLILLNYFLGNSFDFSLFIKQLPSFFPLILIGPISEEFGWRGYFFDKLQKNFSPITSAIITGIIWGLWHLPLFYMVGTSQNILDIPFLSFIINVTAVSIIMSFILNSCVNSLWTAIFFHWIHTFCAQVVATGVTRSVVYNYLEPLPFFVVAIFIVVLWKNGRKRIC